MTSAEIRQQFIDFFVQKHGHTFVPSSPVVPHDDPTLLFTNAGMNQFKPIFLGAEKRPYTRAVNTQKCIRAGGKHNDLDDVGRSRRHHTFFEMLGNWSFDDYFKRGAIAMSWELLTKVWKLDPQRIHVSCYEGDEKAGIPRDTEAAEIWKQVAGLPDDHIHYFGKDNFWEMGDTGPCGPCTEIYYDRRPVSELHTPSPVNGDDPRVMEIWNNVFIQYNRDANGKLTTLPAQHVDTGMGFERITQVLQDVDSNYSIDLWHPFWAKLKDLGGHTYSGKFPPTNSVDAAAEAADEGLRKDIAFRVIADHIRCLTFALTDGATPSNEGRGYVLRRILRRAVRFGRQTLGLREPFLHTLVLIVVDAMGDAFPELRKNPRHVVELVKDEEISFGRTLDRGIALFEDAATSGRIAAADAFRLHDTYGFPIDLTRIMAEERGMTVDLAGYEKLMEQAREMARAGGKEAGGQKLNDLPPAVLAQLTAAGARATDDSAKYADEPIAAKIMAIWNGDDLSLSPASAVDDEELAIILDRTNFYAEMGGQAGDAGSLVGPASLDLGDVQHGMRSQFDVATTKAVGGYILHIGRLRSGALKVGETVTATVAELRLATEKNHTSTHLANWALRETLGDAVHQKGSLVDPEKLRFDFTHTAALTDEQLGQVESLVTQAIEHKLPVSIETVPQEQAMKINGLRAVFGEKYPPRVRVVSVGPAVKDMLADPTNETWRQFSVEFCGGTHLKNSGDTGAFAITAEESVSKGIRRIVALTGNAARDANAQRQQVEALIDTVEDLKDDQLSPAIVTLQQAITLPNLPLRTKRRAQRATAELQSRQRAFEKTSMKSANSGGVDAGAIAGELLNAAATLGSGGKLMVGEIAGASDDQLRSAMDSLKKKSPSHAVMLAAAGEGKVTFVAAVSDDLIAQGLKAGDWVRETAKIAGGSGGGRPQMAQAGGKLPEKLAEALVKARQFATVTLAR